jgi:transposase
MELLHLTWRQRGELMTERDEAADMATYRRVVGLLAVADGAPTAHVAEWLGVTRQSLYNWADRYLQAGRPRALRTQAHSGRPSLWDEDCINVLRASLHQSPEDFGYPAVNWTVGLLRHQVGRCLGRAVSDDTVRRQLHRLGYVWKRPRYVLKPDPEREKKASSAPVVLAAT